MQLEILREKARRLPMAPGVYIMMDKVGKVIYVGKAKLLRNRVSSYFVGEHNMKTEIMVSRIEDFDVIVANSELEALVLENSLIKHHMPRYNILLKDDKGYPFIRVDLKDEYPTFRIVSKPARDGARYFGPYGGRSMTAEAIDAVLKAFKLPTCSRRFPRDIGKDRPCLNYHLGTCSAYCLKDTPRENYRRAVEDAVMVFEGRTGELEARLTEQMNRDAEELRFELAAEKRDMLKAVHALRTKQRVVAGGAADTDAVGFYRGDAHGCFVVLHYIDGDLLDKDYELVDDTVEDDPEALGHLVGQYYEKRGAVPRTVLLPFEIQDPEALAEFLGKTAGHKVEFHVPKRGEKARLVEAAVRNAREEAERVTTREEKTLKTLEWLKTALALPETPERIEAYDISNMGSDDIVAGMTVFFRGRPLKRGYRRFKIRTVGIQDDFHSMEEAVSRRLDRYLEGDPKFSELPQLILIDGGAVHAGIAAAAAAARGLDVPVFGMVKDDRHRTRALVTPDGMEIGISANPAVFAFIGTIQEATHSYAIGYNRDLRSKRVRTSVLDGVPNVGEKRRAALLKSFGSVRAIREADIEQLRRVVPRDAAESIYGYFHREETEE